MVMQEYEYVDSSDINNFLMDELKNQKITQAQLDNIAQAKTYEEKIIAILKTVHDPEIPVNIWDLGLIYLLEISPKKDILVQMTLTAPTCPVADAIPAEVEKRLKDYAGEYGDIKVELVWEPAWTKDMMSEEAKLILDIW